MACRKLISSANKLNLNSVRTFTTSVRTFSSDKKDEIAKVTHTGQVSKFIKNCYANILDFFLTFDLFIFRFTMKRITETLDLQMQLELLMINGQLI